MTRLNALALAFALPATAGLTLSAPLAAQSRGAAGVVDLEKVVQGSTAYSAAINQINTTYAANIQQLQQIQTTANSQLQPIVTQARAEQAKPAPNQSQLQTLQAQANQIQQQAQAQAQQLNQPIEIARAYVADQVSQAIRPAVQRVATNRKVPMVLSAEAALYTDPASDLTNDVIAELNRSLPQVGISPPAEWLQQRGIGAAGQPGAAPAPAPTPQPQGR